MAKRRGGSRGAATVGVLPVLGAVGIVGILVANDYSNTGPPTSPITWLLGGNWQNALFVLSKNIANPQVLAVLIPALIVLWALFAIHKHFAARSRISGRKIRWSLV